MAHNSRSSKVNDRLSRASSLLQAKTSTLVEIKNQLDDLKVSSSSPFQASMKNLVALLCSQMIDMKEEIAELRSSLVESRENSNHAIISAEKANQYSRRNTIVVAGVELEENETQSKLEAKIAGLLTNFDTTVKTSELSHCHRNNAKNKVIKDNNGNEKIIPPTITVVFQKSSKKDTVLKNYSNYDSSTRKKKKVTVYQSLSPYFNKLRQDISKYIYDNQNTLSKCKWIHYRSPSAGICVKTDKHYLTEIFCFNDFLKGVGK